MKHTEDYDTALLLLSALAIASPIVLLIWRWFHA